ncbi:hypothetical protein DTO195F2_8360 [Paecilomyces variotii]|nr:hypothetical protein DTO195F2_8360 [Paecilomyces variotii]KAJ9310212.1 hypothetical protein DTO217A2_498 [Paecilomyces variotii]KAJ9368406.1 hypothetical protein DTO282E5_6874 [Paecilomyces variotii]
MADKGTPEKMQTVANAADDHDDVEVVNASGHKQELERNFSLISICATAVTTGNTWTAAGGSITASLSNGGPPGALYEFIAVSVCYWLVASSIAELASAMPSSSGVYHWASITAGKYGRPCGFFAGWWNALAWVFGAASMAAILGNQTVSMYALFHPDFTPQAWHVFVSFISCSFICCATVLFANRALPVISNLGGFFILAGVFITIIVCAVMPHVTGAGYLPSHTVWRDWDNLTGYSSQGFVFVAGMLNGAYSVGNPDISTHLAEEIPRPSKNVPKAVLAQMAIGFVTGFLYLVAILYSIHDLDAVMGSSYNFPIAEIYLQATGSKGGALGLLIIAFIPTVITCIGCYMTAGRTLWTLSRDRATPFPSWLSHINPKTQNPFNATLVCGVVVTILACIYVGSTTAFQAFIGSFVQLSSLSYLAAILPHLLTKRSSVTPGHFWMGRIGFIVNLLSSIYIAAFVVIFCFPYALPTDAGSMNYACLITGGLTIFVGAWWLVRMRTYKGPSSIPLTDKIIPEDAI